MARSADVLATIHKLSTPLSSAEKAALRAANPKKAAKRAGQQGGRIVLRPPDHEECTGWCN